ncbi:hypothetical protein D3C87_1692340 [compost metagenome]
MHAAVHGAHHAAYPRDAFKNFLGLDQKCGPRGRELDHLAVTQQQLYAEFLLQQANGRAERRLRDRQPFCRASKVQLFSEHAEVLQVLEFHRSFCGRAAWVQPIQSF